MTTKAKPKATSKKVASKAAKILGDDKAGAEERAVAASALAQAEPEVGRHVYADDDVETPGPKGNGIDEVESLEAAPEETGREIRTAILAGIGGLSEMETLRVENAQLREQLRWYQERAAK